MTKACFPILLLTARWGTGKTVLQSNPVMNKSVSMVRVAHLVKIIAVCIAGGLLASCANPDDGFPKISHIKEPTTTMLSKQQQAARKSGMEYEKSGHVYAKRNEITGRSTQLRLNRKNEDAQ